MKYDPHKSSIFDLDANIAAVLVYVLPWLVSIISEAAGSIAWVIPLIALMMESKSHFVCFHSANALAFFILGTVVDLIFTVLGVGTMMTTWLSNIWILGFFYLGIQSIVMLIFLLIFLAIHLYLVVGKILSLIKAYEYKDFEYPVVSKVARFILSYKK